jgi:DNA-binding transcriptional regulator YdaS (Cro superfamily)
MVERLGIKALARCIDILGGQGPTGSVVGRTQTAISECLRKGKKVPAEWCIPLETATRGAGEEISRHQLRPDLYPKAAKPNRPVARAEAA